MTREFQTIFPMEVELDDHETCKHWNLMECKDLPPGTKTIMAIWLFTCKCFPGRSTNTKLVSVLMAASKHGDKTIGILMHPS
jgi:hypothetical protein